MIIQRTSFHGYTDPAALLLSTERGLIGTTLFSSLVGILCEVDLDLAITPAIRRAVSQIRDGQQAFSLTALATRRRSTSSTTP